MADTKGSALTNITDVQKTDEIYIIDDPSGTPASKVATVEELFKGVNTFTALTSVDKDDRVPIVDDPSGTPATRYATAENILLASNILSNHAKGQIIDSIFNIVDTKTNLQGLWFFDQTGASTTLTDRSPKGHSGTLSANGSTLTPDFSGLCPVLDLTSDAYIEIADHDDYSFGNGSADTGFSIIALLNFNDATSSTILAKDDLTTGTTNREWAFYTDAADKLVFDLHDDSVPAYIGRTYDTAITADEGSYHVYIATCDDSETAAGIGIYRDGVAVDDTDHTSGSYTAMENKAGNVGNFNISTAGARENIGDFKGGLIAIIKETLTVTEVKKISQVLLGFVNNLT